jgi:hypothetical protein
MKNNKQLYNIKKIASMKKEALVAGLGSFLSNQTKDPDRTALNLGKAIGAEMGAGLGGLAGGFSWIPTDEYIDNKINMQRDVTNKVIKRLKILKKLTPLLPILGYAGGGYLTHKALNAATKKRTINLR